MDFFREFSKQLSGRGRSSGEKPKDVLARLNAQLRAAEDDLDRLYLRYGMACYDERKGRGDRELLEQLAQRIGATRLQLAELTAARDAASDMKRCPGCGTVHPHEARFCSACGKKLPDEAPKPEPVEPGEYCPACGAKREGGEPRCPVCGADFSAPPPPEPAPMIETPPIPDVEEPGEAMD